MGSTYVKLINSVVNARETITLNLILIQISRRLFDFGEYRINFFDFFWHIFIFEDLSLHRADIFSLLCHFLGQYGRIGHIPQIPML